MTVIDKTLFIKTINEQTKDLQEQLERIDSKHMVDSQKSGYQAKSLDTYIFTNFLLFVLYYCIVIGIAYRMYSYTKYSRNVKIAIVLAFALYPYLISSIEMSIYGYIVYYYALITGNVYVITGTGS